MGRYSGYWNPGKEGCVSRFQHRDWGFGSKDAIEIARNRLAKNLAMHNQTPMLAKTGTGRVGIYGVGLGVVSLTQEAVDFIKGGGLDSTKEGE